MKKTGWLLIIIGLGIFLYPFLERGYTWYWQEKLIRSFEEEQQSSEAALALDEYQNLQTIFQEQPAEAPPETVSTEEAAQQVQPKDSMEDRTVLGMIKIEDIELSLPILEGATEKNLNKGAAQVTGTSPLGDVGNAAIAAHRGYSFGRFFNRLDEIEIGDQIVIETQDGQYEYQVYEVLVVEPDDVSVLSRNNQDEIITLITCTPLYTSTHRLVVHARRVIL